LGQTLARVLGNGREAVFRIRRRVQLMMDNLHKPVCAFLRVGEKSAYCRWPAPFFETREFSYGWSVYRQWAQAPGPWDRVDVIRR
jgi:hypothetical protein